MRLSSGILQQLMLCAGGESEMGSLLALLENAPFTQIGLKIDILKVRVDMVIVVSHCLSTSLTDGHMWIHSDHEH